MTAIRLISTPLLDAMAEARSSEVQSRCLSLALAGRHLVAVRVLREITGASMNDAMRIVGEIVSANELED